MKPPSDKAARDRPAYCYICLEPVILEHHYDEKGRVIWEKVHPTTGKPHECRPTPRNLQQSDT